METEEQKEPFDQHKSIIIPFWLNVLFIFWPRMAIRYIAWQTNFPIRTVEKLHEAFGRSGRIDIFPLLERRGFMLVIENKLSLWFYQDGDGFKYDGFELGEYEKGDISVFDRWRK